MQLRKPQTSSSYLHRVLRDGAKPFRYRSGVRSLLGMPDSEGIKLSSSSKLPPIGFRYANPSFASEPFTAASSLEEVDHSPWYNEPEKRVEAYQTNTEESTQPHASSVSAKKSMSPSEVEERATKAVSAVVEKSQQPFAVSSSKIENAKIEIPGATDKSYRFPALSSLANDDLLQKSHQQKILSKEARENQAAEFPYKVEEQRQPKISPANAQANLTKKALSEVRQNEFLMHSSGEIVADSEGLQKRRGVAQRLTPNHLAGELENPAVIETDADEGKAKIFAKTEHLSQRSDHVLVSTERMSRLNSSQAFVALPHANPVERIEQLRQAVHELASKKTLPQPQPHNEAPPPETKQPPVPTPPVVIIKRWANHAGIPCAFWERSYLSRFHLRFLR